MDIKIFKRNIQLSKLGINELDKDEKKVHDFLMENLSGLNVYLFKDIPSEIYYGKSIHEIVLCHDLLDEYLLVNDDKIWNFFKNELHMNEYNIVSIISWWLSDIILNLDPDGILESSFEFIDRNRFDLKPIYT